jgi:imidazoleglycerol-phosphate dehydratase
MAGGQQAEHRSRVSARVDVHGSGRADVATGVTILDHLLGLLTDRAGFDLRLEVAPGGAADEIAEAGLGLGEALRPALTAEGARGIGSAVAPTEEALAHVAFEVSGRPRLVTNVDLSDARVAGLDTDLVARFLEQLAAGAGLTLHVRLVVGDDPEHVLESIFKALGIALAQACRPRFRKE